MFLHQSDEDPLAHFAIINRCFRVLVLDETCLSLTPIVVCFCSRVTTVTVVGGLKHSHYFWNAFSLIPQRHRSRAHIHLSRRCAGACARELVYIPWRLCSVEMLSDVTAESWRSVGGRLIGPPEHNRPQTKHRPASLQGKQQKKKKASTIQLTGVIVSSEERWTPVLFGCSDNSSLIPPDVFGSIWSSFGDWHCLFRLVPCLVTFSCSVFSEHMSS